MRKRGQVRNVDGNLDYDPSLFAVCHHLSLDEPHSQKEIARELNLHESKVSRLAKQARAQRFLRSVFAPPIDQRLQDQLRRSLLPRGVRKVLVAETAEAVGHTAARWFEKHARSGQGVVLDGGKTVGSFVESLARNVFENMEIVPICADPASYEASAYELMTRMAMKYPVKVKCQKLPFWRSRHLRSIHEQVRKRARRARFVFLGTGPWKDPFTALRFVEHLGLNHRTLERKYQARVCAAVGYCAVSSDGRHVPIKEIDERLPRSLEFGDLRRLAGGTRCNCVLLASGAEKCQAILAVLAAGVCNTLITDRDLASRLLARLKKP